MASVKELEKNKVQVEFEMDEALMQESAQKAYQKLKGRFEVPGFRKGHAPKGVIEKFYGENVFFEEAFEIAFPSAYDKAIDELELIAVSRPENVDIVSMEEGKPIVVSAELYVKPEVVLGQYEGVEVEFAPVTVTDEDVEKELARIQEQNARFVDVDRAAQMGDKVVLDYSGSVNGEKFEGGTAEGQTLDLGSGMFIPGFEEQLVGYVAGQEGVISVTFPEDYRATDLAGKDAEFAVKIVAVKEKQLPDLDDEFAQDISEFDTLEEYKADLLGKMTADREKRNRYALEDAVVKKVVENAQIDLPDCMIENQIDYQMQEMEYNMMYQGLNLQHYLEYTGMKMEDLRDQVRPGAELKVRSQLTLEALKNTLDLQVTDEDLEKEMQEVAEAQGKTLEQYKEGMKPGELEYIKDRALYEKLVNHLVETAKVVEPKEEKKEESAE